ncbi:hypothetical protein RK21_05354 [Pseudomonas plecoglossicida]|nr:hypothetical protein RK21_05354 [Pseudomonas plecoglossicida]
MITTGFKAGVDPVGAGDTNVKGKKREATRASLFSCRQRT